MHDRRNVQEDNLIGQMGEETQQYEIGMATSYGSERLEDMIAHCMPRLFRVADCVLHNRHDSEDALQEGLLLALRHLKAFRGDSRLSTWMYTIIRNSALAKLRQRQAHPMVSLDDDSELIALGSSADPSLDPEEAYAEAELSQLFARLLEGLPTNYKTVITLCDFEGSSGKEAAQRLGITASALKAQHHRARRAIRQKIDGHSGRKNAGAASKIGKTNVCSNVRDATESNPYL